MIALFLGFIFWTFAEYILHRFLGHERNYSARFKKEHFIHHRDNNKFASIYLKAAVATIIITSLTCLLMFSFEFNTALLFSGGFTFSYLLYEFVHKAIHSNYWFIPKYLIKHHMDHHKKFPQANYGVTSVLWDRVFNTLRN